MVIVCQTPGATPHRSDCMLFEMTQDAPVLFHDCGHSSFFKSRKANDVMGFIAGMLTFTPYFRRLKDFRGQPNRTTHP